MIPTKCESTKRVKLVAIYLEGGGDADALGATEEQWFHDRYAMKPTRLGREKSKSLTGVR